MDIFCNFGKKKISIKSSMRFHGPHRSIAGGVFLGSFLVLDGALRQLHKPIYGLEWSIPSPALAQDIPFAWNIRPLLLWPMTPNFLQFSTKAVSRGSPVWPCQKSCSFSWLSMNWPWPSLQYPPPCTEVTGFIPLSTIKTLLGGGGHLSLLTTIPGS